MNSKIMCLIIALVSIVGMVTCGCVNNDCSEMLPIRELFGAKFDEPWGGKLELNDLGRGGADDVSEWLDAIEWYNVQTNDVQLSRFCCRGYYYHASACNGVEDPRRGGPFDGKSGWMASVIADKSTGMILEVYGHMPFSSRHYRRGYEDDCVRKNGGRLKTYLEGVLGPASGDRYLDKSANVSEKPKSGRYCHEYTWRKGCQVIRLSLWYDDSKDGYDGSVMLDVFRTDMGVNPVE